MQKKVVTSLLSGVAVTFILATPALAEGLFDFSKCSGTASVGIQKGNYYENYGIDVADGRLVSKDVVTGTCGDFTAEAGGTVLLSTKGKYGLRGLGDELWLGGTWHPEIKTKYGTVKFEGTVRYRALDHGQGLGASRDDSTELIGGIGYAMNFGPLEFTPFLRAVKSNPVGYNNSLFWMLEGLDATVALPGDSRIRAEYLHASNVNSLYAVPHRNADSLMIEGSKQFPGTSWTGTVGVTIAQYANRDSRYDLQIERDGRMAQKRKPRGDVYGKRTPYWHVSITRAF